MGDLKWRDAREGGWFAFEMKVDSNKVQYSIECTYWGSDTGDREFDILIDGKKIATETLTASSPNKLIHKQYPIPQSLTQNKKTIMVKLQAHPGKIAGGLFGCRIYKDI